PSAQDCPLDGAAEPPDVGSAGPPLEYCALMARRSPTDDSTLVTICAVVVISDCRPLIAVSSRGASASALASRFLRPPISLARPLPFCDMSTCLLSEAIGALADAADGG